MKKQTLQKWMNQQRKSANQEKQETLRTARQNALSQCEAWLYELTWATMRAPVRKRCEELRQERASADAERSTAFGDRNSTPRGGSSLSRDLYCLSPQNHAHGLAGGDGTAWTARTRAATRGLSFPARTPAHRDKTSGSW